LSAFRPLLLLAASVLAACDVPAPAEPSPVVSVELGVFFGGQIQEREVISLVFDRSAQEYGFRIEFSEPVGAPLPVRWEVDMPAPKSAEPERLTRLSEALVAKGRRQLDQVLALRPGDPLGLYNYRIVVGQELVLDRAVWIVEPDSR
jgi:hypothetical protein